MIENSKRARSKRMRRLSGRLFQVLWLVVAMFASSLTAHAQEPKRVLLLQSFGREFSPFSEYVDQFRAQLNRRFAQPIEFYEASLQTARFANPGDDAPFLEYLTTLFNNHRLDLVVTFGAPAALFVQHNRHRLFPSTPLLMATLDARFLDAAALTPQDTFVSSSLDMSVGIANILHVLPATTTIAIALGNSPLEKAWRKILDGQFKPYTDKVNFIWLNNLTFAEIRSRAATLPPKSAIFYTIVAIDSTGASQEQDRLLRDLHAVANAPIFSWVDTYLGRGIVGGQLASHRVTTQRAAEVAIRIFRGETPGSIKVPPMGLEIPMYDWRELQRWGISEAQLPAGSLVEFRQPSLWQQYHWQISMVFFAVLGQAIIITLLLIERHRRQVAEVESRRRVLQVVHMNRTAAAGALSASIAHELNQPLGAILSNTEAAELMLRENPPNLAGLKETLADIREADRRAAEIITYVRRLLKKRSEAEIEDLDLNETIRSAIYILGPEATKRGVTLSVSELPGTVTVRADKIHLQQVMLNLAMNGMDATRDSGPDERRVHFQAAFVNGGEVEVSIADSGTGIPEDKIRSIFETFYTTKNDGTGLGLSIAKTIVETYGGKIWAENRIGGGAVLRFTLPLSPTI